MRQNLTNRRFSNTSASPSIQLAKLRLQPLGPNAPLHHARPVMHEALRGVGVVGGGVGPQPLGEGGAAGPELHSTVKFLNVNT